MKARRPLVALVAACLAVGLTTAAPAAANAAASDDAVASAAQKKKKKKVTARSVNRKLNSTRKSLRTTRRRVNSARRSLRRMDTTLEDLGKRLGSAEGGLGTLLGAAPTLISSLQTLGTAVRDQIAPGLKALSDAVQGQIAPGLKALSDAVQNEIAPGLTALAAAVEDEIAPGLQRLGAFIGAPEYGIGQVLIATPTPTPQAGSFIETPDIPDTVQQAMTSQDFVAQHAGAVVVAYGVRTGESDGTGAEDPAAHCRVTVTNEGGTTDTTDPNAELGGLPFQPVDEGSALTSEAEGNESFPFGLKTEGDDADQTDTFVSSVNVGVGDTYTVGLSCVDLSPDADDPTA